ncbi:hypothetical protein, partial [Aeromonas salmonicida]|uniref:hypothetical protein n=1 Tax=Aeromonas salmonicida TaxID=645 RepID=UPI0023AFCF64
GTVMAVEIMENNLTFKVGRVFLLSHINENPYSLGVQLSGFTSERRFFMACRPQRVFIRS